MAMWAIWGRPSVCSSTCSRGTWWITAQLMRNTPLCKGLLVWQCQDTSGCMAIPSAPWPGGHNQTVKVFVHFNTC